MMSSESIFPKDYWSQPPNVAGRVGDQTPAMLYTAVGCALSAWEEVEERLAFRMIILSHVRESHSSSVVKRLFGSIESSATRMKLLEVTAELHYGHFWKIKEISKRYQELTKGIMLAQWRRNEIAHGKVVNFHVQLGGDADNFKTTGVGAFLIAPEYMIARNRGINDPLDQNDPLFLVSSKYRYTSGDIFTFANKFQKLGETVIEYTRECGYNENGIPENAFKILERDAINASKGSKAKL